MHLALIHRHDLAFVDMKTDGDVVCFVFPQNGQKVNEKKILQKWNKWNIYIYICFVIYIYIYMIVR